ncbi:UNKNOWN [Stylonychia lemnae]|uniref:Exportin-2 central domain-containing protein n=1 Tax=Stylonychia lemnae TaxID=5949 RepID=A0A078A5B4_STYLE|nr:UNKNOWN [Stylonychia lemnae]|eukprot:CDW76775.1 UNKNOWN [Stylonychia lemnae]
MSNFTVTQVDLAFTQSLVQALGSSLNPSNEIRQQAEVFIKQVNQGQQIDICHAAAVQLGSIIEYHWKFLDPVQAKKVSIEGFDFIILDEGDKQLVRENILKCLYQTDNKVIVKQYVRCITTIARFDYPSRWPVIVQEIVQYLSTADQKSVMTGLLGLKGLVKKYEYELQDERDPLYGIIAQTFSILGNLVNQTLNVDNQVAQDIMFLICKIFYTSNQLYLCPFMAEGSNIDPWIQLFKTLMDRPLPAELESPTEELEVIEEREKNLQWKLKGIAAKTTYRLFSKFGNPKYVDEKFGDFSKKFKETFAIPLLESHLQQVFKKEKCFVNSKTLNFAIKYVQQSSKLPITMTVLYPLVEKVLYDIVIPVMFITQKDIQLFKEDSIEYIRKQNDFTESLFSPKQTVVDLLISLCSYKQNKKSKKPDFLHKFLSFCGNILVQYSQKQILDWRIKEAIIYAIGSLYDELVAQKDIKVQLEPMMIQHVMPELQSQIPFLKMRACWIYGEFGTFKFKEVNHVKQAVELIYKQLYDPELPVRLTAATSLHKLMHNDECTALLKPALKDILQIYLKMMSEIDSEELVAALEEIVSHFKDDIAPFAVELTQQLVGAYTRLSQVNADDDDGESALAAVGCVTAVRRILDSIQNNKELILKVEEFVYPMLLHTLTPDGLDSIEDGLDCIALILYHGSVNGVSKNMWKIFPQLIYIICGENDPDGGYGFEYLSQVCVSIQNYIAKDPNSFLSIGEGQTQTFIAITFQFVEKTLKMNKESPDQLDGIVIMKVLIAMLENLKGRIDEALQYILKICIEELAGKKIPKNYRSMLIQVISMTFWYNSALSFQILEQSQQTIPVFQTLLQTLGDMKHDFELRRVIFGLTSILCTEPSLLPALVGQRIPEIMKQLAQLSLKMREQRLEVLKDNEESIQEEQNKKNEDDEEEENEDEHENMDGEATAFDKLKKSEKFDEKDYGDDDDDSDYEYTGGDMAIYDSALDSIDELLYIKETLENINSANAGYMTQLMSGIDAELMGKFNENMQSAQALKDREEVVRKQCDEMFDKKKFN